jgi:hypothetical protein
MAGVWLDGAVYFCTGPTERKARNLAQNPSCVLTTHVGTQNVPSAPGPASATDDDPDAHIGSGPGRPSAGRKWPRLGFPLAYIRVCGNSAERRWNERIFGLRITPSRISIARRMVWSRFQAPGPSITVRRCGISASLISQVAEFHR